MILKKLIVIVALLPIVVACKKEDNNSTNTTPTNTQKNILTIGNVSYEIDTPTVYYYGTSSSESGLEEFNISFDAFKINEESNSVINLVLELFSSSTNHLSGTFTSDPNSDPRKVDTFTENSYIADYSNEKTYFFPTGSFVVENNGSESYSFTLNCSTNIGPDVSATYTGGVNYVDESE